MEIRDVNHITPGAGRVRRCPGIVLNEVDGMVIIPSQLCPSGPLEVSVIVRDSVVCSANFIQTHPLRFTTIRCDFRPIRHATVPPISRFISSSIELCLGDRTTVYWLKLDTLEEIAVKTRLKDVGSADLNTDSLNSDILFLDTDLKYGFGALVDDYRHLQGL